MWSANRSCVKVVRLVSLPKTAGWLADSRYDQDRQIRQTLQRGELLILCNPGTGIRAGESGDGLKSLMALIDRESVVRLVAYSRPERFLIWLQRCSS